MKWNRRENNAENLYRKLSEHGSPPWSSLLEVTKDYFRNMADKMYV